MIRCFPRKVLKFLIRLNTVDGGYTDFGDWSECSNDCGGGTQTRTRTCTNPAPAHGGADCVGDTSESRDCTSTNGCPGNLKLFFTKNTEGCQTFTN